MNALGFTAPTHFRAPPATGFSNRFTHRSNLSLSIMQNNLQGYFTEYRADDSEQKINTHPDRHRFFPMKFADTFITALDFRTIQRPESTHHFYAALRRIRHCPFYIVLGGEMLNHPKYRNFPPQRRFFRTRYRWLVLLSQLWESGFRSWRPVTVIFPSALACLLHFTSDPTWPP